MHLEWTMKQADTSLQNEYGAAQQCWKDAQQWPHVPPGTMMENSRNASFTCSWPCKNQIALWLWGWETKETPPWQVEMHSGTATLEHRQLTENQPHARIWSNRGIFAEWVENMVHTATHKKFIWCRKGHSMAFITGTWNSWKKNFTEVLNLITLMSLAV